MQESPLKELDVVSFRVLKGGGCRGGRYPGNLREAQGALGSTGEHSGTSGCKPPLNPPPLRTL